MSRVGARREREGTVPRATAVPRLAKPARHARYAREVDPFPCQCTTVQARLYARRDSKREELALTGGFSRWGSRRADLPSPQTPRGVVRISFVAPALPAATRRSRRPSNGTIPCPAPTRDVSRVGFLAGRSRSHRAGGLT